MSTIIRLVQALDSWDHGSWPHCTEWPAHRSVYVRNNHLRYSLQITFIYSPHQVYNYFTEHTKDGLWMKTLVIAVW